jgi:glyoxylase-like metal-dependent hydrolase (beta-lactamase superfamily II)
VGDEEHYLSRGRSSYDKFTYFSNAVDLFSIDTGLFKLDGGAMFGVVPKTLWSRHITPDSNNLCTWAMRCMLVAHGSRLILIDTGLGDKQTAKFFSFYEPHGDANLMRSLHAKGVHPSDITDVVLTHLHFDHCGGAVSRSVDGQNWLPTFPNATYWIGEDQYHWAYPSPNPRERASFLPENFKPLFDEQRVHLVKRGEQVAGLDVLMVDGHTNGMMLPILEVNQQKILYCADLLPSVAHLPIAWVMGYDTRPLLTLQEKTDILSRAARENWLLFFEHDAQYEMCSLHEGEKGVTVGETFTLQDLLA